MMNYFYNCIKLRLNLKQHFHMETDDLSKFENDIQDLANRLQQVFESKAMRWFHHEQSDTLYIELEGLEDMDDDKISNLAEPILDDLDLDFEEIILLPYS